MTVFFRQSIVALATIGLFVFSNVHSLKAQSGSATDADATLWPRIEAQLDQQASDTSFQFILPLVRSHCGRDMDCLFRNYRAIMFKLEHRFNIPAALYVCEAILEVAQQQKDKKAEVGAYINLSRYYDALGIDRLAALNIDKAIPLLEQVGGYMVNIEAKMTKLERSAKHRNLQEALSDMDALLAEAMEKGDSLAIYHLHTRILGYKLDAKRYEEAANHIAALETMPVSHPIRPAVMAKLITAARGHATLAKIRGNIDEAAFYYQKALRLCEEQADHWIKVKILEALTELEWDRGNRQLAKSYLEQAHTTAQKHEIDDLLVGTFEWKAYIAEQEGRYADALEYTKKQHFHKEKFEKRSHGFNLKNYYLQQEKEQLEAEKKNQGLELSLKNTQLRYSLLVAFLILLLAAGVFIAYRKQRQGKRKLSEQNALIQQQSEQLKSLDAAKSRFFANVSHELRTPLTLMLGPVGTLLKENQLTDKQTELLQLAHQSGKQLEQLVTDILDLGKLEMGKMELDEKPTEVASFFRSYFAQFESLAESRQIDFSFDIAVGNDAVANLDQAKCRQILNNLLSNAFKFTPAGERVEAKLTLNDGTIQLIVADTGPGIHPDDLPHLFDRYFQTTRPDKPAEGGTGIGLALCYEYAQLFGGKIEVESTLGKGSIFRVAFPVTQAQMHGDTPVSPKPQGEAYSETPVSAATLAVGETGVSPHAAKPTILVVEDNPDLQAYIRLILSEKYHIVTAENGQVAWGMMNDELGMMNAKQGAANSSFIIYHSSLPSLILSDLMMPVMDGHQLLEKLKSSDATRHIPVIMLTARADARDKLKALRIGVDDYLLKPFDEEELLARIENLLKNQAARQQEALAETKPGAAAPLMSQPDKEWLETYEAYVRQRMVDDTLSVSALAYHFAMSESTLLRQLKRLTGLSPIQYLQEMRLDEARRLLENRRYNSIAQVASKVGYDDARSFARSFRARFGKLPSEM
ncbi:MAG: ATP-binding protein [Saprospiraceae bacterium]